MRGRRLFSALLAVLLVSSTVSPIGTAAAATGECSELDEFIWVLSVGTVNADECDSDELSQTIAEMQENETTEDKVSIYLAGSEVGEKQEQFDTMTGNYLQDTRTVVWGKGEAAAVDEMVQNGSNHSVMWDAANASMEEYYSIKQANMIKTWNSQVDQIYYLVNLTLADPDIPDDYVRIHNVDGTATWSFESWHDPVSTTYTLANGSTMTLRGFAFNISDSGAYDVEVYPGTVNDGAYGGAIDDYDVVRVEDYDTSDGVDDLNFFNLQNASGTFAGPNENPLYGRLQYLETQEAQLEANIGTYLNGLYYDYREDQLNISQGNDTVENYVSPSTLAQEYALDYNSTGYYAYGVAYSGLAGYELPDLNTTGSMNVTYNGTHHNGLLFTNGTPPGGQWEDNTVYNASNITGKQRFITQDGEMIVLEGEFTLNSITGKDGEALETVGTQSYYYDTTNSSKFNVLQDTLRELRLDIEEREAMAAGAGGGGFDLGSVGAGGAIVAVAAALFVLGRG